MIAMLHLELARLAFVLLACGSGPPATVAPGRTAAPSTSAPATPGGGPPSAAQRVPGMSPRPWLPPPSAMPSTHRRAATCCRDRTVSTATITPPATPNINIEAQVEALTRAEFDALPETLGSPRRCRRGHVPTASRAPSRASTATTVLAWDNGLSVTIDLARDGTRRKCTRPPRRSRSSCSPRLPS